MIMKTRKRWIVFGIVVSFILGAFILFYIYQLLTTETYKKINNNLFMNGIKLYLEEERLISLHGEGEYIYGFGGHGRNYENLGVRVGIAGDNDNDFYGRVGSIEFTNPDYSVYGVKIGDSSEASKQKIMNQGYKIKEQDAKYSVEDILINGEYTIVLYGQPKVASIQIWFDDKDLRDRSY